MSGRKPTPRATAAGWRSSTKRWASSGLPAAGANPDRWVFRIGLIFTLVGLAFTVVSFIMTGRPYDSQSTSHHLSNHLDLVCLRPLRPEPHPDRPGDDHGQLFSDAFMRYWLVRLIYEIPRADRPSGRELASAALRDRRAGLGDNRWRGSPARRSCRRASRPAARCGFITRTTMAV